MKKPPKIEIAKGAFDDVPEEDRESLMETIKEMFRDFDPEHPPGRQVLSMEPGTTECPICGGELTDPHSATLPGAEGGKALFLECGACDNIFGTMVQ